MQVVDLVSRVKGGFLWKEVSIPGRWAKGGVGGEGGTGSKFQGQCVKCCEDSGQDTFEGLATGRSSWWAWGKEVQSRGRIGS